MPSFVYYLKVASPEGSADSSIFKNVLNTRFCDSSSMHHDLCDLVNSCQIHKCNNFCLRYTKDKNMRFCRCGCGIETEKNSNITPGYPIQEQDEIVLDRNTKIKHLKLIRTTSRRMTQCSTYLLQSWRANCDVQILVYDSDPNRPNLEAVSYTHLRAHETR